MLFDTHAHYDDEAFDADRDALLTALPDCGVGLVIDPGCDLTSSRRAVELAAAYRAEGLSLKDAVRRAAEEAQRLSDALNAQGIPACASMHAQGQGLCIQILLKNERLS